MRKNLTSIASRLAIAPLAIVFAAVMIAPSAAAPVSYVYGIDDSNNLYEIDPVGQTLTNVFTGQSPVSGQSNAFAYDRTNPAREFLFFMNGSGSTTGSGQNLYVWNKLTNSQSLVANTTQLGIGSATLQPANAAFYSDAYWFFEEGTANLYKISLDYTGGTPVFSAQTAYDISAVDGAFPTTTNLFGDIAINRNTGVLYGSTTNGDFYSLDISAAAAGTGDPSSYTAIGNIGGSFGLQLSFSQDYTTLYGQQFSSGTSGVWYTVDTTNANLTSLSWTSPVAFRDLGGASPTATPTVPEIDPASFGSAIALLLGMLGLIERRTLRRLAFA
jgi:hypothetical protein